MSAFTAVRERRSPPPPTPTQGPFFPFISHYGSRLCLCNLNRSGVLCLSLAGHLVVDYTGHFVFRKQGSTLDD